MAARQIKVETQNALKCLKPTANMFPDVFGERKKVGKNVFFINFFCQNLFVFLSFFAKKTRANTDDEKNQLFLLLLMKQKMKKTSLMRKPGTVFTTLRGRLNLRMGTISWIVTLRQAGIAFQ